MHVTFVSGGMADLQFFVFNVTYTIIASVTAQLLTTAMDIVPNLQALDKI